MRNRLAHKRRHRHRPDPTEIKVEIEEAFIPKNQYHELIGMPDAPDLSQFPDGIYVVTTKNHDRILGFFQESQIDKLEGKVIG